MADGNTVINAAEQTLIDTKPEYENPGILMR